jgi:glycine dehydrogenase
MIPLGSCTMKLNATAEMMPVTWPEFGGCIRSRRWSRRRATGDVRELESDALPRSPASRVSLQPNAGSQGEYAGLLVIRAYHESARRGHRDVCLIPQSRTAPTRRAR